MFNKKYFYKKNLILFLFLIGISVFFSTCTQKEQEDKPVTKSTFSKNSFISKDTFVVVAAKLKPTVVNVSSIYPLVQPSLSKKDHDKKGFFQSFFDYFSRQIPSSKVYQEKNLGSGIIISKKGYILTNYHLIEGVQEVMIRLSDKKQYRGKIAGTDPKTDLALIKIKSKKNLPVAILGNSDEIQVGDWVAAIGNPFGLDRTLTVGVISAIGRTDIGVANYENFIQTDASINLGNSGGPLVNINGEVIGINTAMISSGHGISFAIPINMVKEVVDDLIKEGKVVRGWLGIGIQQLTPQLAKTFDLERVQGVLVNAVMLDSPAEEGELVRGDIIIEYNNMKINNMKQLRRLITTTKVSKKIIIKIIRNSKVKKLKVKIGRIPSNQDEKYPELKVSSGII